MTNLRPTVERLAVTRDEFYALADALHDRREFVLLDSTLVEPRQGQVSLFAFEPFAMLASHGNGSTWRELHGETRSEGSFFAQLERRLAQYTVEPPPGLEQPFCAGAIGYLGYELGRELEKLPSCIRSSGAPAGLVGFYNFCVTFHHQTQTCTLVHVELEADGAPGLDYVREILRHASRAPARTWSAHGGVSIEFRSNLSRDAYERAVRSIKGYIAAGDVYQVNMTQRFAARLHGREPWQIYRELARVNPAPFAAYLGFGEVQVLSSSPERFLRLLDRHVETRPIKGTIRRGDSPEEDERNRRWLWNSSKNRAELAMIVDLMRNDLGRVCEIGSVRVTGYPELESYASLHHLVATITGRLKQGVGMVDVLRAMFPGGSITGAPKIRSMEIITELEGVERGVYTGSIGYLGFDGRADLNVAIRTIAVVDGEAFVHAGGGVILDSVEQDEYEESLLKARNLLRALAGERRSESSVEHPSALARP